MGVTTLVYMILILPVKENGLIIPVRIEVSKAADLILEYCGNAAT